MAVVTFRARAAVQALRDKQHWRGTDLDWEHFNQRWDEHSPNLARTISANDFIVLAHWFQLINKLSTVRDDQLSREITALEPGQVRACQHLDDMGNHIAEILYAASQTRRERTQGAVPQVPPLPPEPGADGDAGPVR
jgi:hypothetical protein